MMKLRFATSEIRYWSEQYTYEGAPDLARIEQDVLPVVRETGHYTKSQFLELARWKTGRTRRHCEANEDEFVESVTRTSFQTSDERLRIAVPRYSVA